MPYDISDRPENYEPNAYQDRFFNNLYPEKLIEEHSDRCIVCGYFLLDWEFKMCVPCG